MSPALWLIALPMGAAPLVYLLRRMGTGAILATLVTFLSAWLAVRLPTGVALELLGRTIELDRLAQVALSLVFAATAVLFLLLIFLSAVSQGVQATPLKRIGEEARIFYPAALVILAFFVAASLSRHLGITAIFIQLAAILTVFVIQTERLESTRAALRFLILVSLATPFLLLAAWQIDFYRLSGGLTAEENLERIALFIGLGFAVWLAVIPFHGWLTGTAMESSPPTAAFVLITFPVVAFSTFLHLLVDFPWLLNSLYLVDGLLLAGVFTAFIGGVFAGVQRGFSPLIGYAVLYNVGCTLAALGVGGTAAVLVVLVNLVSHTLALLLLAASLSTLHLQTPNVDGFSQIRGMARQMPVAVAGLVVGGLTLAGAPFTIGFAPYWQLLQSIAALDARWPALLVIGGLGVAVGYLRGLRAALRPLPKTKTRTGRLVVTGAAPGLQEPLPLLVVIIVLSLVCIGLGVLPSLIIEPLQAATATISLPLIR